MRFSNRWMFNRVMCVESVCRRVLRTALGVEVGEITYLNAEQSYEPGPDNRGVRMDVVLRESGRSFDIEMQVARENRIGKRLRYYQSVLDTIELERGDDFRNLSESFILFFCQVDPFGKGLPVYSLERVCRELSDVSVGDDSHWVVLNAQAWASAQDSDLGELLEYVKTGRATGALSSDIDELVAAFNTDRKWVDRVITLEQDTAIRCRRAREEGREEGMELLGALMRKLIAEERYDDAERASSDAVYRDALMRELGMAE